MSTRPLPAPDAPALPIEPVLDDLRRALRRGHVVLQAPTGSGKSTGVPLALLDEDWLGARRILLLQPRRAAARMIAARMADRLGESLGERVGYRIRFEHRIGPRCRIEVITEGILTRRIQSDPTLEDVGLLVFDEFHERSLQSDLGLALALDAIAGLRPDLRLLLMSATLDAEPLAEILGGAAVIRGEGRGFPVEIRYAERDPGPDAVAAVVSAVRLAVASHPGDVLAFLPGTGEIRRCVARLREQTEDGVRVLPLHGSLPPEEQERALVPAIDKERRIVVATDIAETSLTIPGIRVVVDSGLTRKPRFDPGSGLTRLVTESIPRASADQRTGRAGRLAPGICYRLWTRAREHGRADARVPEILQADLASLVLELRLWGVGDPAGLRWIDPPPAPARDAAVELLTRLGALDARGVVTALGRRMSELPIHPRLAVLLLNAAESARPAAADLCALITERDPLLDLPGQRRPVDLEVRLHALQARRERRPVPGAEIRRLDAADRVSVQLQRLIRESPAGSVRSIAQLLALAYPERIAQRREGSDGRYHLAGGRGALLPRDDALATRPYLVVAGLDGGGADARIQTALAIDESEIRQCLAEGISVSRTLAWDDEREAVVVRAVERLEAMTLRARPVPPEASDDVLGILLEQISNRFDEALDWSDAARQLCARVTLLRRLEPHGGWPDFSAAALRADLPDWLAPALPGLSRFAQTRKIELASTLAARLDRRQRQRLDTELPTHLTTPAGRSRRIDYCVGETPVLAVALQELFGLAETPRIGGGRIPLLLHLLSPAGRPIQVTGDLGGFWARGYAEVRKELRGRYPKHAWPEDPTRALPVTGVRRPRRGD